MTRPDPLNLIVTGVGGQGNVLMSQLLGRAFLAKGLRVSVGETFGLSQRGGSVQSHIRVSQSRDYGPVIPQGKAHAIVGLEPLETLRIVPMYGNPGLKVMLNDRPVPPLNVIAGESRYPSDEEIDAALEKLSEKVWRVPATHIAQDLGAAVMANVVLLGAVIAAGLAPLEPADVEQTLAEVLSADRLPPNIEAFRAGVAFIA